MVTYKVIVCIFVIANLHRSHCASTSSLQQMSKMSANPVASEYNKNLSREEQSVKDQRNDDKTEETENDDNADETEDTADDGNDDEEEDAESETDSESTSSDATSNVNGEYEERNCTCDINSSCKCCISLNLSFIDLGGPGCVRFLYMPENDSMAVDMSYGQKLLQTSSIKRSTPEATCMDLFSDLAQMCTKFTQIMRVQNGIKGCLTIEPLLLGVVQSSYNVGCFNMDEPGVQQPTSESTTPRVVVAVDGNITDQQQQQSSKPTEIGQESEEEAEDEEELAAAISQSAEDGLAWFNTLISSVLGDEAATNDTQQASQNSPAAMSSAATSSLNTNVQR